MLTARHHAHTVDLDVSRTAARRTSQPTLEPATLGEAFRLLRHRGCLSRDELASLAKLSAGAVSNYENDVSAPSAMALRRLARALADATDQDADVLWAQLGGVLDRSPKVKIDGAS